MTKEQRLEAYQDADRQVQEHAYAQNQKHREEASRLSDEFWRDACNVLKYDQILTDEGVAQLENEAYSRGHAHGFSEVYIHLADLVDLTVQLIKSGIEKLAPECLPAIRKSLSDLVNKEPPMSFTYHFQHPPLSSAIWDRYFLPGLRLLINQARRQGIPIVGGSGEVGSEPVLNHRAIQFNGQPGYEDLRLTLEGKEKPFCKTNNEPYSVAVEATLILAELLFSLDFRWDADLRDVKNVHLDYDKAIALLRETLQTHAVSQHAVRQRIDALRNDNALPETLAPFTPPAQTETLVQVHFQGTVRVQVASHLDPQTRQQLAALKARALLLATVENPDAPEAEACEQFVAETSGRAEDWDAAVVQDCSGHWETAPQDDGVPS